MIRAALFSSLVILLLSAKSATSSYQHDHGHGTIPKQKGNRDQIDEVIVVDDQHKQPVASNSHITHCTDYEANIDGDHMELLIVQFKNYKKGENHHYQGKGCNDIADAITRNGMYRRLQHTREVQEATTEEQLKKILRDFQKEIFPLINSAVAVGLGYGMKIEEMHHLVSMMFNQCNSVFLKQFHSTNWVQTKFLPLKQMNACDDDSKSPQHSGGKQRVVTVRDVVNAVRHAMRRLECGMNFRHDHKQVSQYIHWQAEQSFNYLNLLYIIGIPVGLLLIFIIALCVYRTRQ